MTQHTVEEKHWWTFGIEHLCNQSSLDWERAVDLSGDIIFGQPKPFRVVSCLELRGRAWSKAIAVPMDNAEEPIYTCWSSRESVVSFSRQSERNTCLPRAVIKWHGPTEPCRENQNISQVPIKFQDVEKTQLKKSHVTNGPKTSRLSIIINWKKFTKPKVILKKKLVSKNVAKLLEKGQKISYRKMTPKKTRMLKKNSACQKFLKKIKNAKIFPKKIVIPKKKSARQRKIQKKKLWRLSKTKKKKN